MSKRQKRKRLTYHIPRLRITGAKPDTLEYRLCEMLSRHCGERGDNEGAEDTLARIIYERNRALEILALDRLRSHPSPFV